MTPGEPAGVQPQEGGRLQCLECGSRYRLLAPHLAAAHSMTSPEYRETHNLPRKLSLRAQDLTDHASEQGRERYADRPDIRAAMEAGRHDRNLPAATRSSQETALRPLVRAARKRGGQGKQASAQQRMDVAAQQLGFDTLTAYLNARQGVTASAMARELGVPRSTLGHWLNLWASTAQPGR